MNTWFSKTYADIECRRNESISDKSHAKLRLAFLTYTIEYILSEIE